MAPTSHAPFCDFFALNRRWIAWCGALVLATASPGAETEDFSGVLDAFSGEWEGEVEVRALDGVVLKTFPIERSYSWEGGLQVVETRITQGDDEYETRTLQSVRLGRLHALVARPFASEDEYVGVIEGPGIAWQNTARNDRDFTEKITIQRGLPKLETSSLEALRFAGITGIVRMHAVMQPKDGRLHLGSTSPAEVAALTARIKELEAELAQPGPSQARGLAPAPAERAAQETDDLRRAAEAAEAEVRKLRTRLAEVEREREELRARLAETAMLNWTTDALQRARADADKEIEWLRRQAAVARGEMTEARSELEAIRAELADLQVEKDAAVAADDLRRQLEAALASRDEAVSRGEEHAARGEALLREIEALRVRSAEAMALNERTRRQLEDSETARATERSGLEAEKERVAEMRQELSTLQQQLESRPASGAAAQEKGARQLAELQARVAAAETIRAERDAAAKRANELEDELASSRTELDRARANTGELSGRIAALEAAVDQANSDWESERQKTQLLNAELREAVSRADELETRLASAEEREKAVAASLREQQQQQAELKAELSRQAARLQETEADRADFAVKLTNAQAENLRLAAQAEQLQGVASAAESEAGTMQLQIGELSGRLEEAIAKRDAALKQAGMLEVAERELVALKSDLETQQSVAAERQADNDRLARENQRLGHERDDLAARLAAAEKPATPAPESAPAQEVAADRSATQRLQDRIEELERRVIERESERNALGERRRLLESQLAEARALRDETLARFQAVVSQLNAMREERDRLTRANAVLQSDLQAARQPPREGVQQEGAPPAQGPGNVFTRLMAAMGGEDVPRTPDTVIASLEVIGVTRSETEDKVILNSRLYRNGDTIDSDLGLVFQGIEADTLIFTDRNGREYRRRF